jgi:hypothetical protein
MFLRNNVQKEGKLRCTGLEMSKKTLMDKFMKPKAPKKRSNGKVQLVPLVAPTDPPVLHELQENKVALVKRGRGKKKIPMVYITAAQNRRGTFQKRLKGVIKKIVELMILTGAEIDALIRNPETSEIFRVRNVVDGLEFQRECNIQAMNNVEYYKEFSEASYGNGIEDLHTLSAGIRERRTAGRKKKVDPDEQRKKDLDKFSGLPENEKKFRVYLYELSKKRYITTSMVNRPVYSATFQRNEGLNSVEEMSTYSMTDENSMQEMSVHNSVNMNSETVTVRQSVQLTVEQRFSMLNKVFTAIREGKDVNPADVVPDQDEEIASGASPFPVRAQAPFASPEQAEKDSLDEEFQKFILVLDQSEFGNHTDNAFGSDVANFVNIDDLFDHS